MRYSLLLSIAACGNQPPPCIVGFEEGDDGNCYQIYDIDCAEGFHTGPDDMCYPDDDTIDPIEVAMRDWPDCVLEKGDSRLDLEAGCADEVCVGRNYSEIAAAMDDPGQCYFYPGYGYGECMWGGGAAAYFADADDDGEADEFYYVNYVIVFPGYQGHTEYGAGPGVSMACWPQTEGNADEVEFDIQASGQYEIGSLTWYEPATVIYDALGDGYVYESDGKSDYMYLYGSQ